MVAGIATLVRAQQWGLVSVIGDHCPIAGIGMFSNKDLSEQMSPELHHLRLKPVRRARKLRQLFSQFLNAHYLSPYPFRELCYIAAAPALLIR